MASFLETLKHRRLEVAGGLTILFMLLALLLLTTSQFISLGHLSSIGGGGGVGGGGGDDAPSETSPAMPSYPQMTTATSEFDGGYQTVPGAISPPPLMSYVFANITYPRGIRATPEGDLLVVSAYEGVYLLWDDNNDGLNDPRSERVLLTKEGNPLRLNHFAAVWGDFMYASGDSTVYRWNWDHDNPRTPLGASQRLVRNIPTGGHSTRTLLMAHARLADDLTVESEVLLVSCGSGGNLDTSEDRSQIRAFALSIDPNAQVEFDWSEGVPVGTGLRNEVGIDWDDSGRLWGVQNGIDNLYREDLGGDVHETNPGEELNLILDSADELRDLFNGQQKPKFAGYPRCWSEWNLGEFGMGVGTQWATSEYMVGGTSVTENEQTFNDTWCRDTQVVTRPRFSLEAHGAPLDLVFVDADFASTYTSADYANSAFVTLHGSWNKATASGHKLVLLRFDTADAYAPSSAEDFLSFEGAGGPMGVRPVSVQPTMCFGTVPCVLVTSDASDNIIAVLATYGFEDST